MIDLLFQITLSNVGLSLALAIAGQQEKAAVLTAGGKKAAFFSAETWSQVLIFFNGRKHGKELSK